MNKSKSQLSKKSIKNNRRQINNFASYFYMPIIFIGLFALLSASLVLPNLNLINKAIDVVSVDKTKNQDSGSVFTGFSGVKNAKTVDCNAINFPSYGDSYGQLTCDELGINSPIILGDGDKQLKQGVCQYNGSLLPGYGKPVLLSAHNTTYFEPLKNVQLGQVFTVTTSYGVFEYQVTNIDVKNIANGNPFDLQQGEEQLIMYTCYPFEKLSGVTSQRLFVYCDKVSGPVVTGVNE